MSEAARLLRVPIRSDLDPGQVLHLMRGEQLPFALTGGWAGGGAILGSRPIELAGPDDDPFALLERQPVIEGETDPEAVGGGWFGWLGYAAGALIEKLPSQPPRPVALPPVHLARYDNLLHRDRRGAWWFEALVTPRREAAIGSRLEDARRLLAADPGEIRPASPEPPEAFRLVPPGADGHLAAVARCRERIRSGEFFQANLRVRLESGFDGDLASLFSRVAGRTAPDFGAVFLTGEGGIASLSPELFLRRRGRQVETGPIKGTVIRPDDSDGAEAARADLAGSPKDAAEHVMIVDVARNDLGRVCRPGTVVAPDRPEAVPHPGLWHLVSMVRGELAPDAGDGDLLRAAFPPCSVTGAPKIQAMRAIAGLEPLSREVFTGAIGFASPLAGLELSVAIRTFEARGERIWLDVGGGIVADSDPGRELAECLAKARPLIEAAGSRIAPESSDRSGAGVPPPGVRWAPSPGQSRPDPRLGLIETVRVKAGRPERAERHLKRLEDSLRSLYGVGLPADLAERVRAAATDSGDGALRLEVLPDGSAGITVRPLPQRELPVAIAPIVLPGGLGCHKWADRRLLDGLGESGPTPLLIDSDGTVLEAGWGNVWIADGGQLITPPADGRILPGVSRAVLLEVGEWEGHPVREKPFGLDRLAAAAGVYVSSSLAGLVPASLAG